MSWRQVALALAVLVGGSAGAQTFQEYQRIEELRWRNSKVTMAFLDDQLAPKFCLSSPTSLAGCLFALDAFVSEVSPFQNVDLDESGRVVVREIVDPRGLGWRSGNLKGFYQYQRERFARFQKLSAEDEAKKEIAAGIHAIYQAWRPKAEAVLKPHQIGRILNEYLHVWRDPHTNFLPHPNIDRSSAAVSATTLGFRYQLLEDRLLVTQAIPGLNAFEAGLKAGDLILSLDGKSIAQLGPDGVRAKFFTPANAKVVAQVERLGRVFKVELVSQRLEFPLMVQRPLNERQGGARIEYLRVSQFPSNPDFCKSFYATLEDLQSRIDGLILDLRGNGGGEVGTALCMLNAFLGRNRALIQTYNSVFEQTVVSRGHAPDAPNGEAILAEKSMEPWPQVFSRKTVILIDAQTASAAELFAGVMKFYGAAYVVGERSFGKGTFQLNEDIMRRYMMLTTLGTYHFPDGTSPQLSGVRPQLEVGLTKLVPQDELVMREEDFGIVPLAAKQLPAVAKSQDLEIPEDCYTLANALRAYQRIRLGDWRKDLQLLSAESLLKCVTTEN